MSKWCVHCRKDTHNSAACWSTHGINNTAHVRFYSKVPRPKLRALTLAVLLAYGIRA